MNSLFRDILQVRLDLTQTLILPRARMNQAWNL